MAGGYSPKNNCILVPTLPESRVGQVELEPPFPPDALWMKMSVSSITNAAWLSWVCVALCSGAGAGVAASPPCPVQ